jgi:hypothetical protein
MGHHSCCNKQKVKRGLWSPEEDEKLIKYVTAYGHGCWSVVPKQAGLQRCGKSCRLRWINYLRPDLKRGSFSLQEERLIIDLHKIIGNRWAQIAKHLPGRTDNEVKNFWNSCIKKKLMAQGIDLKAHKLLNQAASSKELQEEKSASLINQGFAASETRDGLKRVADIRELVPGNYMGSFLCAGNADISPYYAIHGGTWMERPTYGDYVRPDQEEILYESISVNDFRHDISQRLPVLNDYQISKSQNFENKLLQPETISDPTTFSSQMKGFDQLKHPFLGSNNPIELGQFGMDAISNYQSTNNQLDTFVIPNAACLSHSSDSGFNPSCDTRRMYLPKLCEIEIAEAECTSDQGEANGFRFSSAYGSYENYGIEFSDSAITIAMDSECINPVTEWNS